MLFSEPKIPQSIPVVRFSDNLLPVSVLFSEPKIPQSTSRRFGREHMLCFSALQRAENSSILLSSGLGLATRCFSALQRAENSSMYQYVYYPKRQDFEFQCSSASRKFLNSVLGRVFRITRRVSVLFSEPKIPQCI